MYTDNTKLLLGEYQKGEGIYRNSYEVKLPKKRGDSFNFESPLFHAIDIV